MNSAFIDPLFSTPLYRNKIEFSSDVQKFIKNANYVRQLNAFSTENFYMLDEPGLSDLKKNIKLEVDNFLYNALSFSRKIEFLITTSWLIKHAKGDYSPPHFHSNSLYSGIVYIQVNDDSGDIIFSNNNRSPLFPRELFFEIDNYYLLNSSTWKIRPKNKDILIFPSHLTHEVTSNLSDEERYVLAFNLFPSGIFSEHSINELKII